MQRLLFDFLFFSLGGTAGVIAMCILQAGRQSDRKMMELKDQLVQKFLNKWTIFLFCSILFSSNQKEH